MAVTDSDVMGQMAAGRPTPPPGAPPAAVPGAATPSSQSPAGAPMASPEPKLGNREGAIVNLGMALDLIEQSLPALGSESPEGKAAIAALNAISKIMGPKRAGASELQPAEIQQLVGALPQGAGGPPELKAMMGGAPSPGPAPGMGAPPAQMAA